MEKITPELIAISYVPKSCVPLKEKSAGNARNGSLDSFLSMLAFPPEKELKGTQGNARNASLPQPELNPPAGGCNGR